MHTKELLRLNLALICLILTGTLYALPHGCLLDTSNCFAGTDQSVCVILATLLCCFSDPDAQQQCQLLHPFDHTRSSESQQTLPASSSRAVAGDPKSQDRRSRSIEPEAQSSHMHGKYAENGLTKENLRKRLAYISTFYPFARPSRGNLKEVFSFVQKHAQCVERGQRH